MVESITSLLSERAKTVLPFMAMEVLEHAQKLEAKGQKIIHMEVGEPDFETPDLVVEAMKTAMGQGHYFYTHSLGDIELRQALSDYYLDHYGVSVGPDRFLVTAGTSPGMLLVFGAILNPGEEVIISNPHYSCYPNLIKFFGGKPHLVEVKESDGFRFSPDELLRHLGPNVKAILINSPANPTGAILGPELLKEIAKLDSLIISDEIYHGLNYQSERDHCILEYTDKAVVIGGFSKSYAMTGWRIGYLILPPDLVRPLQSMAQNFFISVNAAVQKAAIVALKKGWPEVLRMRAIYDRRRRLLVDGLRDLGLGIMMEPTGAFYVLANARHISSDSRSLVFELLEKAGVGTSPGIDFGSGAEGFVRFSYATSEDNIKEALTRLKVFLSGRKAVK